MTAVNWESWIGSADLWIAAAYDVAEQNDWNVVPNLQGNAPQDSESNVEVRPTSGTIIMEPRSKDVVFGRGTGNHNHPGNKMLRRRVRELLGLHSLMAKTEKSQLIRDLTRDLLSQGVRFMRKDGSSGHWHVVDDRDELHKKVSHCFRTMKDPRRGTTRRRAVRV